MTSNLQDAWLPYWPDLHRAHPAHLAFPGKLDQRTLGAMLLVRIDGACYRVERTVRRAQGGDDYLILAHQRGGMGRLHQHGATTVTAPGDLVLYSTAQPYLVEFDGAFQQTLLRMPSAQLRAACADIGTMTGVALSGMQPQVALLRMMMESYFDADHAGLPPQMAEHASLALCHAVAACALTQLFGTASKRPDLRQYHLDRIRQFALGRLGDSELAIPHVVQALGISASHIHRLFASEGQTFGTWLWESRLQACHLALRNPGHARQSISQIAFAFGFSHAAHFSRAYRARYGMTPSAWRSGMALPLTAARAAAVPAGG